MGTYSELVTLNFAVEECCQCGIKFGLLTQYQKQKRDNRGTFYCPNGHGQAYQGESEVEKMRRERDIARQQVARAQQETRDANLRTELLQKQKRRMEKRAAAGTCPCCQRNFTNMSRHMKIKHPEFVESNVVRLKK